MQSHRTPPFHLFWTLAGLAVVLAWDASGLDLAFARPFASAEGFLLRDTWFLASVLHEGARKAAWLPALWLIIGVWMPTGIQRRLTRGERVQWAAATLLALLAVSTLKQVSHTSCPWDLAEFGGRAQWVSHWVLGVVDGGPGRCFPAGHASAGFAFIAGYFVLARYPRAATLWLAGSLVAGLVLGGAQQLRGAHFMSHTLWTAWLCWTVGWLVTGAARQLTQSRSRPNPRTPELPAARAPAN